MQTSAPAPCPRRSGCSTTPRRPGRSSTGPVGTPGGAARDLPPHQQDHRLRRRPARRSGSRSTRSPRSRTATRLINAYQRGVNVQMIFNDHKRLPPGEAPPGRARARTRQALVRDVLRQELPRRQGQHAPEGVPVQQGRPGREHRHGRLQQHDPQQRGQPVERHLHRRRRPGALLHLRGRLRPDEGRPPADARSTSRRRSTATAPSSTRTRTSRRTNDPLYLALSQISCLGAADGYGTEPASTTTATASPTGSPQLRLSQHAWNGDRGIWLAQKVAELKRAGCDVEVIYGVGIGRRGQGRPSRATGVPMTYGTVKGNHTHQKVFIVSGVFAGDPASTLCGPARTTGPTAPCVATTRCSGSRRPEAYAAVQRELRGHLGQRLRPHGPLRRHACRDDAPVRASGPGGRRCRAVRELRRSYQPRSRHSARCGRSAPRVESSPWPG